MRQIGCLIQTYHSQLFPGNFKELMRHASVTTTEKYYVDINAQETAKFLRQVTLEVTPTKKGSQQNTETLYFIVLPQGLEP